MNALQKLNSIIRYHETLGNINSEFVKDLQEWKNTFVQEVYVSGTSGSHLFSRNNEELEYHVRKKLFEKLALTISKEVELKVDTEEFVTTYVGRVLFLIEKKEKP